MALRVLTLTTAAVLAASGAHAAPPAAPTAAHPTVAVHPAAPAKPAAAPAPAAKPSMFSRIAGAITAKPAATPAAKPAVHHASATANGRMVTTKTSTGKTITYNCSKAGNANKKACQ